MADNKEGTVKYYRSTIAGLSIHVAPAKKGEVAPESIRFEPFRYISDMGEDLYFGYLKTDDPRAHAILEKDSNVTEIKQSSYEKYTNVENEKIDRVGL